MKTTCLHDRHLAMGAKMTPFAGFDMPLQYSSIIEEHKAVRENAGMFDVSHMGEILVTGVDAEKFVNYVFTNDIRQCPVGGVMYGMLTNSSGGVVDDLLVYRQEPGDSFFLVVNASNTDKDFAHLAKAAEGFDLTVANVSDEWAQLAVQGPNAEKVVSTVLGIDACKDLSFYNFAEVDWQGHRIIISRTGYTGEDGFELYADPQVIVQMWDLLCKADVTPCGLGARDTLRFEAGLPLYGDELGDDISPIEAGLGMFCKLDKDFIGRDVLVTQKAEGTERKLVGLELQDRAVARAGYSVEDDQGNEVGRVTTGYHSITLGRSLCMAMIDSAFAALGTPVSIRIRKKTFPASVVRKRFYQPN